MRDTRFCKRIESLRKQHVNWMPPFVSSVLLKKARGGARSMWTLQLAILTSGPALCRSLRVPARTLNYSSCYSGLSVAITSLS